MNGGIEDIWSDEEKEGNVHERGRAAELDDPAGLLGASFAPSAALQTQIVPPPPRTVGQSNVNAAVATDSTGLGGMPFGLAQNLPLGSFQQHFLTAALHQPLPSEAATHSDQLPEFEAPQDQSGSNLSCLASLPAEPSTNNPLISQCPPNADVANSSDFIGWLEWQHQNVQGEQVRGMVGSNFQQLQQQHLFSSPQPAAELPQSGASQSLILTLGAMPMASAIFPSPLPSFNYASLQGDFTQLPSNVVQPSFGTHQQLQSLLHESAQLQPSVDRGSEGESASETAAGRRQYRHEAFPQKLYRLLEEAVQQDQSHIISFTRSGLAFRVHNPEAFARIIAPRYFRHNQYHSFQRQLNKYGFERIHCGPEIGSYTHPLFQQNRPDLLQQFRRTVDAKAEEARRQRRASKSDRKPPPKPLSSPPPPKT